MRNIVECIPEVLVEVGWTQANKIFQTVTYWTTVCNPQEGIELNNKISPIQDDYIEKYLAENPYQW